MDEPIAAINEVEAQNDVVEAAGYHTDAIELRDEAQQDLTQADAYQHMGLATDATTMRTEAAHLQVTADDFDRRSGLLAEAAGDLRGEVLLSEERDHVRDLTATADAQVSEAQDRLKDPSLSEADKTTYVAQSGAATGQAAALRGREDALTLEMDADRHQATADEDEAHKGMEGRPIPGQGHPPTIKPDGG